MKMVKAVTVEQHARAILYGLIYALASIHHRGLGYSCASELAERWIKKGETIFRDGGEVL